MGAKSVWIVDLLYVGLLPLAYVPKRWLPWYRGEVVNSTSFSSQVPPDATDDDVARFMHAEHVGAPLPPGFSVCHRSSITAALTGRVFLSRLSRELVVTISATDLSTAALKLDGETICAATREDGCITVENGVGEVTMVVAIPLFPPFDLCAEWTGEDGQTGLSSRSFELPPWMQVLRSALSKPDLRRGRDLAHLPVPVKRM